MTIVGRVPADLPSPAGEHLVSVVIPTYRPRTAAALAPRRDRPAHRADGLPGRGRRSGWRRSSSSTTAVPATRPACCARWSRPTRSSGWSGSAATTASTPPRSPGCPPPAGTGSSPSTRTASTTRRTSGRCWTSPSTSRPASSTPSPSTRARTEGCGTRRRGPAKRMVTALSGGPDASVFHSYRLVLGEVGRSVAAYAGAGVYLDIALGWVAGRVTTAPVELRDEGEDRTSGYSLRTPGLALLADGAHRRHPRAAPGQRARTGVRAARAAAGDLHRLPPARPSRTRPRAGRR